VQISVKNIVIFTFTVYSFIIVSLEDHIKKSIGVLSVAALEALVCKAVNHTR